MLLLDSTACPRLERNQRQTPRKRRRPEQSAASDAGRAVTSGAPKILKSLLAQFRVPSGVLDRAVAQPILYSARVVTRIGQRIAAGVPAG